jgi:hypothetical protein
MGFIMKYITLKTHNNALQLIHKSGAPIVAPLLFSTELNRYIF